MESHQWETSIPECLKERYQFQNVLGQGGTSVVYLAFDKVLQRKRAVKIVDKTRIPTSMTGQKEWSMFQKLCHPGLAELYDVVEDDLEICFVMEYIEGKTLQQMLSSGYRFSEEEAVHIGIQIIQILIYLHSRNPQVIYRDLKPSNLMISPDGTVRLIDFGTAREYCPQKEVDTVFWGTAGYAAPEQLTGHEQTGPGTDIYSFGILLYEMAYGKRFHRNAVENPTKSVEIIVEKCTRLIPEHRYRSAEEVLKDLTGYQWLDRKKRRKWHLQCCLVLIVWVVTAGLFSVSGMLLWQSERLLKEGYVRYLEVGKRSVEIQERIGNLKNAIFLNPWEAEPYLILLEEAEKQEFPAEIYEEILAVLNQPSSDGTNCEECLRQSEKEYGAFSYQMGIACYFLWEGYGNKSYAKPWLENAMNNPTIDENEKEAARVLVKIAGYYEKLGQDTYLQNEENTYAVFWEDLCSLSECTSNQNLRKLIAKEILAQILQHVSQFCKASVQEEEIWQMIQLIEREIPELESEIQKGKEIITLVYQMGE